MTGILSEAELAYMASQRLGRLATVRPDGAPQNNPVAYSWNPEAGTVDIGGWKLAASHKFKNLAGNQRVSLVIDDLASLDPWTVRGIEIRGRAEALTGQPTPQPWMSSELIRIHPERITSWGIESDSPGMRGRRVAASPPTD